MPAACPHTRRGSAPPRRVIGASDARRVSTRHVTVGREAEHLRGALRIPVAPTRQAKPTLQARRSRNRESLKFVSLLLREVQGRGLLDGSCGRRCGARRRPPPCLLAARRRLVFPGR
jgi:hypothetical protein